MRSFIISIVLLCIMFVCILLNNFYIQALLNKMLELTDGLPSTDSPDFGTISSGAAELPYEHWNKNKSLVSCTVNSKYISAVSDLTALVRVSFASGNKELYLCSRELLKLQLEELKNAEQLSFLGIL